MSKGKRLPNIAIIVMLICIVVILSILSKPLASIFILLGAFPTLVFVSLNYMLNKDVHREKWRSDGYTIYVALRGYIDNTERPILIATAIGITAITAFSFFIHYAITLVIIGPCLLFWVMLFRKDDSNV